MVSAAENALESFKSGLQAIGMVYSVCDHKCDTCALYIPFGVYGITSRKRCLQQYLMEVF